MKIMRCLLRGHCEIMRVAVMEEGRMKGKIKRKKEG
jgi:hypothetical protein